MSGYWDGYRDGQRAAVADFAAAVNLDEIVTNLSRLSRISRTPVRDLTTADDAFWRTHPLTPHFSAESIDAIAAWVRALDRVRPVEPSSFDAAVDEALAVVS